MRSHRTAGLDQLGPAHYRNDITCWMPARHAKHNTITQRATVSTKARKVKITLPNAETLRILMERS